MLLGLTAVAVQAQDADVFDQYMQQQAHQQPMAAGGGGGGGGGLIRRVAPAAAGWLAGQFTPRLFGGQNKKTQKQLEHLYKALSAKNLEIQKLNKMVIQYEYQNQELKQALLESEQEALQRDYEEFKQPDANGDDVISRAEFSQYIRNYMKAYPHIPPEDYPTFEDFDMDRNGLVTFQEWQEYLYQQQLAEKQQGRSNGAAQNLYGQASGAQDFNALYEQLQQQLRQQQAYRR